MAKGQFPARYSLSLPLSPLSDCDLIFLSLSLFLSGLDFISSLGVHTVFSQGGTVLTETPVCTDSQR